MRKHRLVERLLTDFMGYTPAEAHVHADEIGESFSDEMIERVSEKLGHPDRCPHGWPVDTDFEQAENRELAPLSELEPGSRATIVRLAEHDGELLHWFYDQGFVPGTDVEVREAQPYTIRRLEFHGEQRFSDRYYRRRVLVAEGESFDPERLERGLAQLARTGFIRPIGDDDDAAEPKRARDREEERER